MDETVKKKIDDLRCRAAHLRRAANERPSLATTLEREADRLEAEADALLRSHSDEDDMPSPKD